MVLIKEGPSSTMVASPCELRLESARLIRYLAPSGANPRTETRTSFHDEKPLAMRARKNSKSDVMAFDQDGWEGVNMLCQHLDTVIDVEHETDLFDGKSVLELGFATGLPSVFAMDNGAAEVTVHCPDKQHMDRYVKPTLLRRNNIAAHKCKFSSGHLADLKNKLGGKKFDVIVAPELLACSAEDFDRIHQILDAALSSDGICFFTSRTHYFHADGSLPVFNDMIKRNRCFDWHERWTCDRSTDVNPRKVIQLTRAIY